MTSDRLKAAAGWVVSLGSVLILWQVFALWQDKIFFPPPTEVFPTLYSGSGLGAPAFFSTSASRFFIGDGLTNDVIPSMWRMLRGYALATFVGVGFGVILGLRPLLLQYFEWIINFTRAIPPPALLGVWLIVFGIGDWPKVLLIAAAVVWPILLNTIDGVRNVDEERIQAAQVFGIPFRRRLTSLYLPSASPKILAGMRISLGFAFVMMLISEYQAATNGLGLRLNNDRSFFNYKDMWATMVVIAALGLIAATIFVRVERYVLRWHEGSSGGIEI